METMPTKSKKKQMDAVVKANPKVDRKVLTESIEIIESIRKIGIKSPGFNLLRSSESHLKVRKQAVFQL
jgi:hypothetical protein